MNYCINGIVLNLGRSRGKILWTFGIFKVIIINVTSRLGDGFRVVQNV